MEEKSYFEKLLTKYGIRRIDFCKAYGIHTNNFNRLSNLQNIKVLDLKRIHDITKIPYNLLVGETMFTPQNIDTQQVTKPQKFRFFALFSVLPDNAFTMCGDECL